MNLAKSPENMQTMRKYRRDHASTSYMMQTCLPNVGFQAVYRKVYHALCPLGWPFEPHSN